MRVAYLCADPGIPVFGTKGASVHVQEIVRAFRARGDVVTVYCTRRGVRVPADLADLRVVEVPVHAPDAAAREVAIARASEQLAAAAKADGCDLVYERYSLFRAASAHVSRATGAPVVLEVNAPLIDEQRVHRELIDDVAALAGTRAVVAEAHVVACVSEAVADWVRTTKKLFDAADARIIVAPNGVNTRRITPSVHHDVGRPFTIGFVGTLKPWHGVDLLVAAADAASGSEFRAGAMPWRLVIAGDGPERPRLRELAARVGNHLEVVFTGALDPDAIPRLLNEFDVAVAPYPAGNQQYFSPLKVFEYLAAGLPVVASAVGQIPSLIGHGTTGMLVPPGDGEALANALLTLRNDPALRSRLGAAARDVAVDRYDWAIVLERILGQIPEGGRQVA